MDKTLRVELLDAYGELVMARQAVTKLLQVLSGIEELERKDYGSSRARKIFGKHQLSAEVVAYLAQVPTAFIQTLDSIVRAESTGAMARRLKYFRRNLEDHTPPRLFINR